MAVFDGKAIEYDEWYKNKMGKFVDYVETKLAFDMFNPTKGMKILDVGCGTGNFSIKLAEKGCKVIGIDVSNEMLKFAEKKAKEKGLNIEFYQMDAYNITFDDNSFDGVFSMAAFEFIKEPQKAFDEMYRVLKPGGELLIGTINRDSSWGRLYASKDFRENSVFKYAYFKSFEELKALEQKNLVSVRECLFIPPDTTEEEITIEKEEELSKTERGGFICALWKKEL